MTWSAPMDRTRSTFSVLHTPVTSAPNALAICTANAPTPPDAPMTSTLCPDLHVSAVPHSLQGREGRDADGRRLLEGEVRRLGRELVLGGAGVFGEGALGDDEHLVAWLSLVVTPCRPLSMQPCPTSRPPSTAVLGHTEPIPREAHRVGQAGHEMPGAPIHAGCLNTQHYLAVADHGPLDLPRVGARPRPRRRRPARSPASSSLEPSPVACRQAGHALTCHGWPD